MEPNMIAEDTGRRVCPDCGRVTTSREMFLVLDPVDFSYFACMDCKMKHDKSLESIGWMPMKDHIPESEIG